MQTLSQLPRASAFANLTLNFSSGDTLAFFFYKIFPYHHDCILSVNVPICWTSKECRHGSQRDYSVVRSSGRECGNKKGITEGRRYPLCCQCSRPGNGHWPRSRSICRGESRISFLNRESAMISSPTPGIAEKCLLGFTSVLLGPGESCGWVAGKMGSGLAHQNMPICSRSKASGQLLLPQPGWCVTMIWSIVWDYAFKWEKLPFPLCLEESW